MPVAVVIPTLGHSQLLGDSLTSLQLQGETPRAVVVDNGSGWVADWLASKHPEVQCIRNSRNLGFAAAVNQGICATHSEWVALLNDDALPAPDWLAALLRVGESTPEVGAVASRMMFRDCPDLISSAGIRLDLSGAPWDLWLGEAKWPERPVEVFGASGGACLLRRSMLEDVGLYEESFFAYLEDADLAWRARLRGWKAMLAPGAVVYHALSATAGEGSRFKRYLLARNKWWTIIRNYPTPALTANLPVILVYDLLSSFEPLFRGDTVPTHGRLHALQAMPKLLAERRYIQGRRLASWNNIRRAMDALESPLTRYRRVKFLRELPRLQRVSGLPGVVPKHPHRL